MNLHRKLIGLPVASAILLVGLGSTAHAAPATTTCGQAFTAPQVCTYTGGVQSLVVPAGVDQVNITAIGGDGSGDYAWPDDQAGGYGAEVSGTLSVQPGQRLLVSVGGQGEQGGTGSSDPRGGWGGLGDNGGNGNGASDHLRTSGAGGGATTVQVENADGSDLTTVIVSAGGGGGGGASGDPGGVGNGGSAGDSWSGASGTGGSAVWGGSGGKAAAQPGGSGARGSGGSGLGGNGGGGGGGVNGGDGGGGAKGTSAGGGGGSGSCMTNGMTDTSIADRYPSGSQESPSNGEVDLTWQNV